MIIQRKVENSPIDILWYVNETDISVDKQSDILVPTGHMHIVYNLDLPYFLRIDNKLVKVPDRLMVGQLKQVVKVNYSSSVKQIGLALKPSAAYYLFHQVSKLYDDTMIDCEKFKLLRPLHQLVESACLDTNFDVNNLFDKVEKYFKEVAFIVDDSVDEMINYLELEDGSVDIKKMAADFHLSISALERRFKKYIGLSPKQYADIIRFKASMKKSSPEVLFYDQSHFIRTCKKYTSKVPSQIAESVEISLRYMLET